jgi:hypothetical protein
VILIWRLIIGERIAAQQMLDVIGMAIILWNPLVI